MNLTVREFLTHVRWEATQLRDSPVAWAHDAGVRMLAMVEAELTRPAAVEAAPSTHYHAALDPATIPNEVLLEEIARRVRLVRYVKKLCTKCEREPVRAKGLCMKCYRVGWKSGNCRGKRSAQG